MQSSSSIEQEMSEVPMLYIIGAFIPATMVAVLYYFDHSVAAQLAQQKEFNLRKPPSFHYDLLLLGLLVHFFPTNKALEMFFQSLTIPLECFSFHLHSLIRDHHTLADFNLWPSWHTSIKWCHPTIPHAYKELSYSKASSKLPKDPELILPKWNFTHMFVKHKNCVLCILSAAP